ncbi:hypothetical protein FRC03_002002 [Tulasnella sp. 419]|nr:hypothetical protein FRC02_002262 [Tulasnella sp. 418]KAG8969563.1 hypothetical protein FRC03_002002 [Tulasnella sp. 419]
MSSRQNLERPSSSASRHITTASAATETLSVLHDISQLFNTQLDKETLAVCVRMIEGGANPEALATVIKELRKESESRNATTNGTTS